MTNKENEKIENLLASSQVYQFLSMCLLEPEENTFKLLKNKDYMSEVESCLEMMRSAELSEAFRNIKKELQDSNTEKLSKGYRDTFGGATVAMDCPPYEMYFSGSQIYQQTQDLADISGFYKAFGVEVSRDDKANRWDHVAVELEFLHFLTYKLAYAMENAGNRELDSCLDAKKKFLNAHIGRWICAFSNAVGKKSPLAFYREIADLTNEFIHLDMKNLGVDADEIDGLMGNEPDYLQRLEGKSAMACDTCMDEEHYG